MKGGGDLGKNERANDRERQIMKSDGKLGPRMSNFYVEMDAFSMHTMKFPKKFANMFKGSIRENVELEGPSGFTWHVKMIRSDNTFALQSGWKEFVTANEIDEIDILVFTYKDNSSFKVLIFDRSGCEKVAPFFAKIMNTEPEAESEESNDSSTRVVASSHCEVEKEIISLSSGSSNTDESSREISIRADRARTTGEWVCSKMKQKSGPTINSDTLHQQASKFLKKESEESEDSLIREIAAPHREVKKEIISLSSGSSDTDESSCEISTGAPLARTSGEGVYGKRKQRDFVQESTESESNAGKDNRATKASRLYVVPLGTHLTQAQEEIANRMARKTQKDSHLLVRILTLTNIPTHHGCILKLPVGFACNVFQSSKKDITLLPADLDERNSVAAYYYSMNSVNTYGTNKKNKKVRCIREGWCQFASVNGLKQGDLCLFEVRKPDNRGILTMVIHFNLE